MPPIAPISHRDLVHYLKQCGFDGPKSGGKHLKMVRGDFVLTIPNPHEGDIGKPFLLKLLKRANISREEWEAL